MNLWKSHFYVVLWCPNQNFFRPLELRAPERQCSQRCGQVYPYTLGAWKWNLFYKPEHFLQCCTPEDFRLIVQNFTFLWDFKQRFGYPQLARGTKGTAKWDFWVLTCCNIGSMFMRERQTVHMSAGLIKIQDLAECLGISWSAGSKIRDCGECRGIAWGFCAVLKLLAGVQWNCWRDLWVVAC